MTVQECILQSGKSKFWLCPSIVHNARFNAHPLLAGYECSKGTIPEEISDREVTKHYSENGVECIFWDNSAEFEAELNLKKKEDGYVSSDPS